MMHQSFVPSTNTAVSFAQDGAACAEELDFAEDQVQNVFQRDNGQFEVDIIAGPSFARKSYHGHGALQQELLSMSSNTQPGTHIISISQQSSIMPLKITKDAMQDILACLNVNLAFFQIICAFNERPRLSEAGLDCFSQIADDNDPGSWEIMYLYRFAERKSQKVADEWVFRQTGVYHKHNESKKQDTILLLQPHSLSQLDGALQDLQDQSADILAFEAHPIRFHQLLYKTYFTSGWRQYLRIASDRFNAKSNLIFTEQIGRDNSVTHTTLVEWRDLADQTAALPAMVESSVRILRGLRKLEDATQNCAAGLKSFIDTQLSLATGLQCSAQVLLQRIDGVIGLLANTIDIKNQHEASILNKHMQSLTQDTVDDSANVKIVTILSLVYIPASFVATLFGMNFFVFNTTTRSVVIARDFWIFVVLFIPLTCTTLGSWWILSHKSSKHRKKRDEFGAIRLALRG